MTEVEIKTIEDALRLIQGVQLIKPDLPFANNCESVLCNNTSHFVYTLRLVQLKPSHLDLVNGKTVPIRVNQLTLVDLAAEDKSKRAQLKPKETGFVSSSLMALRNCLEVYKENALNNTNKVVNQDNANKSFFRRNKANKLF